MMQTWLSISKRLEDQWITSDTDLPRQRQPSDLDSLSTALW